MKRYRFGRLSMGWQIMIGLVLGIVCGVIFYQNKGAITVMQSLGTIFIRLIQMIVMPIVVSCLTVGIANIGDIKKLGRIGAKTLIYFEVLTTIALLLGIGMANLTIQGLLSIFMIFTQRTFRSTCRLLSMPLTTAAFGL